ncbi:hypothetical protein SAMN02910278_01523 [Peptostreptococcus sp. D1]|nr:hypothetical protein SAMN02910278_01523 [Peptostreptococcus sp. D1]
MIQLYIINYWGLFIEKINFLKAKRDSLKGLYCILVKMYKASVKTKKGDNYFERKTKETVSAKKAYALCGT